MRTKPLESSVCITFLLGLFISLTFVAFPSPALSIPQEEKFTTQVFAASKKDAVPSASATSSTRSKPLKLLILVEPSPFTYVSGYSNRYQALIHSLVSTFGDQLQVITAEVVHPEPPKTWSPSNFENHDPTSQTLDHEAQLVPIYYTRGIRCPGYGNLLTLSLDWTFRIPRVLWKNRPDIIHASTPGFIIFPAVFWSRIFQIPLVCSYHTHLPTYIPAYFGNQKCLAGLVKGLLWFLIRVVFVHMADLVLVTSPQIQQELAENGIPSSLVWQKGIDTHRFNPRHYDFRMRRRMIGLVEDKRAGEEDGSDNGTFLMLYVGRLSSEKRLKDIRAILQAMPSSTRLCFVGQGPQEEDLKQYFANTPTVFLGQLQGEELSSAFASADVFVMPSDTETLGFVVLESMASGVPVVGARAGGIPDLIRHGRNGFLVRPGSVPEFVAKLVQLERNPSLRREMAIAARREMQRWTWQASVTRLRNEQYTAAWGNFSKRPVQRFWRWVTGRKTKDQQHPPWLAQPGYQYTATSGDEELECLLSPQEPRDMSQYGSAKCQ